MIFLVHGCVLSLAIILVKVFHRVWGYYFPCQHKTGKFHTWEALGHLTLPEIEYDFSHAFKSLYWHLALFNYKLQIALP